LERGTKHSFQGRGNLSFATASKNFEKKVEKESAKRIILLTVDLGRAAINQT